MALYHGRGVARQPVEGLRWLRQARDEGVPEAAAFWLRWISAITKPSWRGCAVLYCLQRAPGQARGAEFGERCLIMPMTQAMDCLAILSRHLPGLARILSGDAPAATVFTAV